MRGEDYYYKMGGMLRSVEEHKKEIHELASRTIKENNKLAEQDERFSQIEEKIRIADERLNNWAMELGELFVKVQDEIEKSQQARRSLEQSLDMRNFNTPVENTRDEQLDELLSLLRDRK